MKFFNSHLSPAEIADLVDGRLTAEEQSKVNAHLANCNHCRTEFSLLEKAVGLMRSDAATLQDAPSEALAFAKNLYRAHRSTQSKAVSPIKKITAFLTLEVSPFAPAFGERSAASATEKQMLFSADDFDLDLRVRQGKSNFTLAGQIFGDLKKENSVCLERGDFKIEEDFDENGEFALRDVPAGNYDLRLRIGEIEVNVSDLMIE